VQSVFQQVARGRADLTCVLPPQCAVPPGLRPCGPSSRACTR